MKVVNFEVEGNSLRYEAITGVVLDTDQRSDTHVTGSGHVVMHKGTGSGYSNVNSEVIVSRDIWIKVDDDKEHHMRYNIDIPIRSGQKISQILLKGNGLFADEIHMSIYNHSTNKINWLDGHLKLAKSKSSFFSFYLKTFCIIFLVLFAHALITGSGVLNGIIGGTFLGILSIVPALFLWFGIFRFNKKADSKIKNEHALFIESLKKL